MNVKCGRSKCKSHRKKGRKLCAFHLMEQRNKSKQRRITCRALKRCLRCDETIEEGTSYCSYHNAMQNAARLTRVRERKQRHDCPYCGKKAESGKVRCKRCRDANRLNAAKNFNRLKINGCCLKCGGKLDNDKAHCSVCVIKHNDYQRNRQRELNKLGKCTLCSKAVMRKKNGLFYTRCETCKARTKKLVIARNKL